MFLTSGTDVAGGGVGNKGGEEGVLETEGSCKDLAWQTSWVCIIDIGVSVHSLSSSL